MDGFVLISAVNLMGRVLCGGGCLDDSLVCGVFQFVERWNVFGDSCMGWQVSAALYEGPFFICWSFDVL